MVAADLNINVGSIEVQNLALTADSRLSTNVGRIEIRLPERSEFYLDAETNVGRIDSDFEVEGLGERRVGSADRLKGAVGRDPNVRLRLQTNTGAVSIRKTQ